MESENIHKNGGIMMLHVEVVDFHGCIKCLISGEFIFADPKYLEEVMQLFALEEIRRNF